MIYAYSYTKRLCQYEVITKLKQNRIEKVTVKDVNNSKQRENLKF